MRTGKEATEFRIRERISLLDESSTLGSQTYLMEFLNFQQCERRQTEAEQTRDVNFHEDTARPLQSPVVDDGTKWWRDVDDVRHISLELHHKEFHNETNVVSNVETMPQSKEKESDYLRDILVACGRADRELRSPLIVDLSSQSLLLWWAG